MKRSGFRRLTLEEVRQKQSEARERKIKRQEELQSSPFYQKPEKKKPSPEESLKKKLWAIFSKYIRKSYADPMSGMVMTCDGVMKHWTETHCGHLFHNSERSSGLGGNALWYYERNFAPQSSNGNYFNANDSAKKYMLWACKRYGAAEVEHMRNMKKQPRKWTMEELQALYEHYKREFDKL